MARFSLAPAAASGLLAGELPGGRHTRPLRRRSRSADALAVSLPLAASSTATGRLEMLDLARVLAGLAVVWFHAVESDALRGSGAIGRFSVAFYTLAATFILVQSSRRHPDRTLASYAASRFTRLYVPFLAWSAIHFLLNNAAHAVDPLTPALSLHWQQLITGTAMQLWFLPFALVAGIVVFPVARWMARDRRRAYLVGGLCAALGLLLDVIPCDDAPARLTHLPVLGPLVACTWNRWSAVYFGTALGVFYPRLMKSRWLGQLAIAGFAIAVAATIYQWHVGAEEGVKAKLLAGAGFFLFASGPWTNAIIRRIASFGPMSFGVYLSHMTVFMILRAAADLLHIGVSWQRDVALFVITSAICIALCVTLWQSRRTRWLVA